MLNPATDAGTNQVIRLMIVDDHPIVREGLRAFLQLAADIEIVAEAGSGSEAVIQATSAQPDVIVMDMVMPGELDGIAAIARIHTDYPAIRLLALTSFQDGSLARAALQAGACGYLYKDVRPDLLLAAIRQAAAGQTVVEGRVWETLQSATTSPTQHASAPGPEQTRWTSSTAPLASLEPQDHRARALSVPSESLTAREFDVLRCLARGMSNKEIGAELGISEKTVKVHASHIFAKLQVYDRTQAILKAHQLGYIHLS